VIGYNQVMRCRLKRIVAIVLSVALTVGVPIFSHAKIDSSQAAAHELHAVTHYADLSIDPEDDGCPHAASPTSHQHDNGLCDKCCAACASATILPSIEIALLNSPDARELAFVRSDVLVSRSVPTEPGIPKAL
jgi:hypothetical protein